MVSFLKGEPGASLPGSQGSKSHMDVISNMAKGLIAGLDRPTADTVDRALPCTTHQALFKGTQQGRHYCPSSPSHKGQTESLEERNNLLKTTELIRGRATF